MARKSKFVQDVVPLLGAVTEDSEASSSGSSYDSETDEEEVSEIQ